MYDGISAEPAGALRRIDLVAVCVAIQSSLIACKWKFGRVAGFRPVEGSVATVGGTSGSVEGTVVGAGNVSEP